MERLLAGPSRVLGPESLAGHRRRLGSLSSARRGDTLIRLLESSGLLGRGGAGFPVGSKWRSIAERGRGRAVVLANGAEGEPWSFKDRILMRARPHLVIDGAILAAETVGADEIVLYVGEEHRHARLALDRALDERRLEAGPRMRVIPAPIGYVSGEASAAVNFVNRGEALPTATPPRPSERGVRGMPTLVQNVESLAYAALIARFGADWYRSVGRSRTRGTALVTVNRANGWRSVREIELGTTVGSLAAMAEVSAAATQAVLLGGYFGSWVARERAWTLPLDPAVLRAEGLPFGCGLVSFLPVDGCGVSATAEIMGFMASASAGQCGPCVFGLAAIGGATTRLAGGQGSPADLSNLKRWSTQVRGRGACRHPDGAVELVASSLQVFADDFQAHADSGRCIAPRQVAIAAA
ncbi:MAG TPA: NADH-ubiquinone oxidoreductase-F iron-sulfur binding region domain-containing protein [Candidatus Limnocylindrales bacterium]|jgi:NADH:ubiquinone oxidoreductase subunit F (NADH-binding)